MEDLPQTKPLDIVDVIGGFGSYQKLYTLWICYLSLFTALTTMGIVFMTPELQYQCADADFQSDGVNQCSITVNSTNPHIQIIKTCKSWIYTSDVYAEGSTLTEKFNLVCDREWYISLASSVQQAGDLLAGLSVSYLSDRFGRRPICILSLIPGAFAVVMFIFVTKVEWFIVAKFLYGFTGLSANYLAMVIVIEMSGEKYRGFLSIIAVTLGYSLGYTLLPGIYWLIRNEHHFHIFVAVVYASLTVFFWAIPESPRWLLVKDRQKECAVIVKRIQKFNGITKNHSDIISDLEKISQQIKAHSASCKRTGSNYTDLFRGVEMVKRSLIMFFCWFVAGLIYLGVGLTAESLPGNMFLNVFLLAFIELPSMGFCLVTERYFGRKTLLVSGFIVTGIVYFITIAAPTDIYAAQITMVVLGKFFVNSSFNFLYPYTPELFPTSIRSTGVGIAGGFSSLGSVISPFVSQLIEATNLSVAFGLFGVLSILSGITIIFLPETKNKPLPETLGDVKLIKP